MDLDDPAKRQLKADYDKVCSELLSEEVVQLSCLRNMPDYLTKRLILKQTKEANPQLTPEQVEILATQEIQRRNAAGEAHLAKFVITEEVRALRRYRQKKNRGEILTQEDEQYLLGLFARVKEEQAQPDYEVYATVQQYSSAGEPETLEKHVLRQIIDVTDQMRPIT